MFLSGPEPGEQRKNDGFGSWFRQSDGLPMVDNSSPSANSKQGESALGRRRRERGDNCVLEKGGGTPPYIGQGGGDSSSPPPCGTKPQGGGFTGQGGEWDPPLAPSPRGELPSSPNGPHGPI